MLQVEHGSLYPALHRLQSIANSAHGPNVGTVGSIAVGLSGILNNLTSAQKNRLERKLRQKDVAKLGALIVEPTREEIREFGSLYEEIREKTRPRRASTKKVLPRRPPQERKVQKGRYEEVSSEEGVRQESCQEKNMTRPRRNHACLNCPVPVRRQLLLLLVLPRMCHRSMAST